MKEFLSLENIRALDGIEASIEVIQSALNVAMINNTEQEHIQFIMNEVQELLEALEHKHSNLDHVAEELGDVLFTTIILWCSLKDKNPLFWKKNRPLELIHNTALKFGERLLFVENILKTSDQDMTTLTSHEWRALWKKAKDIQRNGNRNNV